MPRKGKPPHLIPLPGGKASKYGRGVKPKGTGRVITVELWQLMDRWWKRSSRIIWGLARQFEISGSTAAKIVNKGYPDRNLPPLRERGEEYDKELLAKGDTGPAPAPQSIETVLNSEEWARTKRTNITAIRNTRGLIALIQNELIARWNQDHGVARPLEALVPTELRATVGLVRSMANALKDLGEEERKWLHGVVPDEDNMGTSENPFEDLTPEQAKYIRETGRLPPGLDPTRFYNNLHMAGAVGPKAG